MRHGEELQKKLENASAAICGLGGLGSNIAIMLARAGVGKLTLIDFDRVDISNINRQQYLLRQIGMNKTDAMREIISEINPYTEITTHAVRIDESNIGVLLGGESIICEAFDGAESKALLVNEILENYPGKYIISASGMAGLASANGIITRKITGHFYICGDGKTDVAESGSLVSSRVTVCAAHQANAVISIIAGESPV